MAAMATDTRCTDMAMVTIGTMDMMVGSTVVGPTVAVGSIMAADGVMKGMTVADVVSRTAVMAEGITADL